MIKKDVLLGTIIGEDAELLNNTNWQDVEKNK